MKKNAEIIVLGFLTNDIKDFHSPIPNEYLSTEINMPKELVEELKSNGWVDSNNQIWWNKDFRPNPAIGLDGNVYVCLNDIDLKDLNIYKKHISKAYKLLRNIN